MRLLFLAVFLFSAAAARAEAPVDISADTALVWDRAGKTYTATGNATVTQGALSLRADSITANYQDGGTITAATAAGGVVISSAPYTAYGDRAVYDLATGEVTLTGADLRIETPDEKLTGADRVVFHSRDNRLTATGKPQVTRGSDRLSAAVLSAFFTETAGRRSLSRMTAEGGVTITTARETVTGARGVYDVAAQKAELTGGVRVRQGAAEAGGSEITGTRAEIDLKTGLSKLYGDKTSGGRVRAVFYPKKAGTP